MERVGDDRLALVCIIAIGVAMRLMYLAQPMRYDEAVTYLFFVRLSWTDALSTYTYPNNHLFHTLLVKASVSVFGGAPWVLRLPAFVAGSLVIPAVYGVARAFYGSRPALFATAVVASSGVLVLYSTNARGYSLVVLAFLLLALLAIRMLRDASHRDWAMFSVIAALGLWTIPVMLYPLGTVAIWFVLSALAEHQRPKIAQLLVALGFAAVLALLAYAPVIAREGLAAITHNRFVTPSSWAVFIRELPATLGEMLRSWSLGVPRLISYGVLAFAVLAIVRHSSVTRFRIGLHVAALAWCVPLLIVSHRAPFPRVWLWLFPVVASLAGAGIAITLDRMPASARLLRERTGIVAIALALGLTTAVVTSFAVLFSRDTGTFRDAETAATELAKVLQRGDYVRAGIPTNALLDYYLDRGGVDKSGLAVDEMNARRVFVVVDSAEGQTLELVIRQSVVRDSTEFVAPKVLATLPSSRIYLFERRKPPPAH